MKIKRAKISNVKISGIMAHDVLYYIVNNYSTKKDMH